MTCSVTLIGSKNKFHYRIYQFPLCAEIDSHGLLPRKILSGIDAFAKMTSRRWKYLRRLALFPIYQLDNNTPKTSTELICSCLELYLQLNFLRALKSLCDNDYCWGANILNLAE